MFCMNTDDKSDKLFRFMIKTVIILRRSVCCFVNLTIKIYEM